MASLPRTRSKRQSTNTADRDHSYKQAIRTLTEPDIMLQSALTFTLARTRLPGDYSREVGYCLVMRLRGGISTVAHVLTHPLRSRLPGGCLFIGIVNDKGRYRQHREMPARGPLQAMSLATEIPSRSFTASRSFCLLPMYRSVVCTEVWPSRN